jgi:hypothetical protein
MILRNPPRLALCTVIWTAALLAPRPATAQCGYHCTDPVSLCSDQTSCKTSACTQWVCGTLCNDCQSEEGGLCFCPDGAKVYPDVCNSLGNCTTQCSTDSPLRPHDADWLREKKLFAPIAKQRTGSGGTALLASSTSLVGGSAP